MGLWACHRSALEVGRLLAWWPSVGLERGLTSTGHLLCVRPRGSVTVHFLGEPQRGQGLAQGHTARDEAGRCAEPTGLWLTTLHRSALSLGYHKARVTRGVLQAEAALRRPLGRACFVPPRSPSSGQEEGPGAAHPGSRVTGLHPGESSSLEVSRIFSPGNSQPRKTVTSAP